MFICWNSICTLCFFYVSSLCTLCYFAEVVCVRYGYDDYLADLLDRLSHNLFPVAIMMVTLLKSVKRIQLILGLILNVYHISFNTHSSGVAMYGRGWRKLGWWGPPNVEDFIDLLRCKCVKNKSWFIDTLTSKHSSFLFHVNAGPLL